MGSRGNGEDEALMRLMEVATLCSLPMALKAAIHLNVFEILAHHGGHEGRFLSAAQIAARFDSPPSSLDAAISSLDRILQLLASHGLLSSSLQFEPDGRPFITYGINSTSRYLVHTDKGSFAPFVSFNQDSAVIECLYDLHEAVLDPTVARFTKVHGMNVFSYAQHDKRFNSLFNMAMVGHTKLFMHSFLETYHGFDEVASLVDVGGGSGICLGMITSKYPHIKGINFDLPHVLATAPTYPGVEHVGGDMLENIPKGDAIFMKWILHACTDAQCLKILENCYQALPAKGKVIIVEFSLPVGVENNLEARLGYHANLVMLTNSEGGREHTKLDFENFSKATGFTTINFAHKVHGISVIELYKK